MRLTELQPRWIEKDGKRVAFMFRNPTGPDHRGRTDWLTCFCVPIESVFPDRWVLLDQLEADLEAADLKPSDSGHIVLVLEGVAWKWEGDSFENLTVTPSIDASASGNWHGFITNGEIT